MNVLELLTKRNIEILKLIDKEELHIRDIADRLKISPGTVHKLVRLLKKNYLITEKKIKNRIVIKLNRNNSIIKQLKVLINFNEIINASAYKRLRKHGKIGIYGSFAQGINDAKSDLDLWIKTDKKELELRPLIRDLEKQLKVKVNLLVLNNLKINSLKKNDPEFYLRLRLTSIGDALD